jgi:hypothetical protein
MISENFKKIKFASRTLFSVFFDSRNEKHIKICNSEKERGAALAVAVIVIAILSVVALTALAFSSTEARIAGSDLQRTQTFYAASASLEKMTNDFSNLFTRKMNPTDEDLAKIENSPPEELEAEDFTFQQTLEKDTALLTQLQATQNLAANVNPLVNIPEGPYSGLFANIIPYKMTSTARREATRTEIKLEREFNNYLIPLFQFGMFSNGDIEIHPGPLMTFNGRIHSNGNLYALSSTRFLNRVTTAGEFVRDAMRGGETNTQGGNTEIWFNVGGIDVQSSLGKGSVSSGSGRVGGPNIPGSAPGTRGYYPGSPNGFANPSWETESVKPATAGVANRFGGQLLTQTTGATKLKLPLELAGNSPAELIKRSMTSDEEILSTSRYHTKSQIRILIDDETAGSGAANAAGIPAGKGVLLHEFIPLVLNGGGNVLKQISNSGTVSGSAVQQKNPDGSTSSAMTVRAIKNSISTTASPYMPPGAGIRGRILIEIVKPDGATVDVTQTILSMGVTVGEPNAIVHLQRPLWAAFVQGSRDRRGNSFDLVNLTKNYQTIADGEIKDPSALLYANRGFINTTELAANEDTLGITREASPVGTHNQIVPINIYNVREGWYRSQLNHYDIYERGVTSVVELNMRNLARWLDGVYDNNLLSGTNAVSTNIEGAEGYVVYVSDRRGDRVKAEYLANGTSYASTNGLVDNEDIYGPNNTLDGGEDVIDFGWNVGGTSKKGTLQKDTRELPDSGTICCTPTTGAAVTDSTRIARAASVLSWRNTANHFRRSVRLFDGETLSTTAAAGKLSPTKGITVASENMVYIWGNYNTTGITGIPTNGSTLNDGGYTGAQVPASIVCDAFFPLSKTWFDASSALYPDGPNRIADENLPDTTQTTSVRAGIIAGMTISSLTGTPGRDANGQRRNGGIHNFPRFLELWNGSPWNHTGSFIPLYNSTQALSQHEDFRNVNYSPPRRNWSFDTTFLTSNRLPPGTPFFQYIQATGFRQSLR